MKHDEVIVGKNYWTMVGSKPVEVEVIKVNSYLGYKFRRIWTFSKCRQTTYSRHAEELFENYNELRDFIFPKLIDENGKEKTTG